MISDNGTRILEYDKILKMLSEQTLTIIGRELADSILPKTELASIKLDLAFTSEAFELFYLEKDIPINCARDLRDILKKVRLGVILEPTEIMCVYNTLLAVFYAKNYLCGREEEFPLLSGIGKELTTFPNLVKSIEKCLDDRGAIKDDASKELRYIRSHILILKNRVRDKLDDILRSAENQKYFQEQLVTMRGDRYVIPIKQEYRNFFPGIVHDQSASKATLFIEPLSIVSINNDIKKLILDEKKEIERILSLLSKEVITISDNLKINMELIAKLDLIFAKAKLSMKMKAICPEIEEFGDINIIQGRHPLIAEELVVALDITIPRNINTLLITGPNTGGKTVSLKLVGLFILMAQSGLFIPASSRSSLPIFKKIFADIGDEQSIEQSLSTFSGHMKNIINITEQADEYSLVLLDELCAGTDPSEGAALAKSILIYLQNKMSKTLVTTHYNELKIFALQQDNMLNACVEFDVESLSPKYRLIMGVAGSSNAFHISQRLGLSKDIIKAASGFIGQEQARLALALTNLEQERIALSEHNRSVQSMESELRVLKVNLEKERKNLKIREQSIIERARLEAEKIKTKARQEVENIVAEIKSLEKEQNKQVKIEKIKKAREVLQNEWTVNSPDETCGAPLSLENIELGQTVFVTTLGQVGRVISWNEKNVYIQIGGLKTYVKFSACLLSKVKNNLDEPKKERKLTNKTLMQLKNFKSEIDIRGFNVEEATGELEKYIDDAILVNMSQVRIIHGKGTGMLKKGVLEYLEGHRAVKSFRDAELSEGGSGATIVCL